MDEIQMLPFHDEVASLYAPFEGYVKGIAELMLRHLLQLTKINKCSADQQLGNVAWLPRLITIDQRVKELTTENQVPHWPEVRSKIINHLDTCKSENQADSTISNCMDLVMPVLEGRFVAGYVIARRPFNCWWYTIHEQETVVAIHIVNAIMPRSPFNDIVGFAGDMLSAIEDARSKHTNIKHVEIDGIF